MKSPAVDLPDCVVRVVVQVAYIWDSNHVTCAQDILNTPLTTSDLLLDRMQQDSGWELPTNQFGNFSPAKNE